VLGLKRRCIIISVFCSVFSYNITELYDAELDIFPEAPCYFVNAGRMPRQILKMADYARLRNPDLTESQAFEIGDAIWEVSYDYDLEPELLMALIETESNFGVNAVSRMGAKGLTQVMTRFLTGKNVWLMELEEKGIISEEHEIFEIKKNITAGAYILRLCLDLSDSLEEALWRYYGEKSLCYANSVMTNLKKIKAY